MGGEGRAFFYVSSAEMVVQETISGLVFKEKQQRKRNRQRDCNDSLHFIERYGGKIVVT